MAAGSWYSSTIGLGGVATAKGDREAIDLAATRFADVGAWDADQVPGMAGSSSVKPGKPRVRFQASIVTDSLSIRILRAKEPLPPIRRVHWRYNTKFPVCAPQYVTVRYVAVRGRFLVWAPVRLCAANFATKT